MRVLVVYESMYGNTHRIAEAIGRGFESVADVTVVPACDAGPEALEGVDLLVVGGPTHAHGMSRASTRSAAAETAHKPDSHLVLEPEAERLGLREWLAALPALHVDAIAFDTRAHGPVALTGRASKAITRELRRHGCRIAGPPESFLVTGKEIHLEPGEEARAEQWARGLLAHAA